MRTPPQVGSAALSPFGQQGICTVTVYGQGRRLRGKLPILTPVAVLGAHRSVPGNRWASRRSKNGRSERDALRTGALEALYVGHGGPTPLPRQAIDARGDSWP